MSAWAPAIRDEHSRIAVELADTQDIGHSSGSVAVSMAFRPVGEGLVPSRPVAVRETPRRGTSPRPTGTTDRRNGDIHDK